MVLAVSVFFRSCSTFLVNQGGFDKKLPTMDLKFLLPFLTLYQLSEAGCPAVCNCSETSVLCMENGLETIPSFRTLENDPVIIDLSGNKIDIIGPDDLSFEKTNLVKEVYLNKSDIFDIDYEAFDEMENLQELYLADNLLNSIPDNLIEDLPNMVLLDLSNNYFSGKMPVIKSQSLEVLALANCKITTITSDSLKHLPNLRILILQQNNIKFVDPKVFESVPKMFFVRLSYNMWECSCKTMELFEFLARKKFVDSSEPYKCSANGGKSVDIFGKRGIDAHRGSCRLSPTEKTVSSRKKNHYLTKPRYKAIEAGLVPKNANKYAERTSSNDGDSEIAFNKSLSLVKQNGTTGTNLESTKLDKGPKVLQETEALEENAAYTADEGIEGSTGKSVGDNSALDDLKMIGCEPQADILPGIGIGLDQFLLIILSFIMGCIFGFCVNQFLHTFRYRKLETSDSTAKLKIDFN
ncbi:hypothetical protein JTB14_034545 [Gonioctena quinquepunctata]|nr:hypothetical protein JTB14_034545 [Gonioctena quinquepunctata]